MLLFIIIVITIIKLWYEDCFNILESIAWGGVIGILLGFIIMMPLSFIPNVEYVVYEEYPIYAFQNTTQLEGSFFLGSGYINEENTYIYLTKTEDGGVQLKSVPANKTTVYETKETPKLIKYDAQYVSKIARFFLIPMHPMQYKIYIPENSIIYNYNLQL